jgi:magnesium chelatase subunit I
MIMGDRGTGKSTTIRALADLLPDITIIKMTLQYRSKRFGKKLRNRRSENPMVELPLEPRKIEYVEQ